MPLSTIFQLYRGVNKLYKLTAITTRPLEIIEQNVYKTNTPEEDCGQFLIHDLSSGLYQE